MSENIDLFECSKCGKEKPHKFFNADKKSKRGFRCICKACEKTYRLSVSDRTKEYRQTEDYKRRNNAKTLRQYVKNKAKVKARSSVHNAIKSGLIQRPSTCSSCGVTCKPEAHHANGYSFDNWLKIEWLCIDCHKTKHIS